jgi:hypothetical protein
MMSTALGSSKPLANPRLCLVGFFNLMLADTNHSTAAAAALPSDKNSNRYFITLPSQQGSAPQAAWCNRPDTHRGKVMMALMYFF